MKSGKSTMGYKTGLRTLRRGKAKMLILSSNIPPLRKSEVEYYAMLAKTPIFNYKGTNTDLGTSCGKFFRVSMVTILDQGDSDILSTVKDKVPKNLVETSKKTKSKKK